MHRIQPEPVSTIRLMNIHLRTLGCRLNEAELEHWSREFQAAGHRLAAKLSEADLVVINTCAVTGEAVRKSRKLIRRMHRENPRARLVASGCFMTLDTAETAHTLGVDLVVSNRDKDRLVEIAQRELDLNAMPRVATEPGESPLFARGRQRAFVKVQDGCRYRCSFCIVTVARGEERSHSLRDIVDEVNLLHRQGIQEVVLTGVHLGGYGRDNESNLEQLLQTLFQETDIPRLRLGSVEPWDLRDSFWALFDNPRLMPHLHLPLQSGADSVLRRMARRCRTGDFTRLVGQARRRIPDFNVTTDIMVGFPGETEAEWRETLNYCEAIGFGQLHIFAYSPRQGTKAAGLTPQVMPEVKRRRSRELHSLGERMHRRNLSRYLGREFPVLMEGRGEPQPDGQQLCTGYTPNFLKVAVTAPAEMQLENRIRPVRLERVDETGGPILARLLS